ncbi:MAG TPA: glycine zipper 2TM domain-containing protein [Burkholderiaceae bacterium]|nr:glycine zipper 2TM domain-containing protein [Burkholderiaceae bacterium]
MNNDVIGGAPVPARAPRIHPLVAIAAVSVAATALIAGAQFLRPHDANSAASGATVNAGEAGTSAKAPTPAPSAAAICAQCGVVVGVRTERQKGEASGAGAVAGGVVGGLAGHQFGRGGGNEAMTILGAVGGAVAGHQIEKQVKARTLYLVDLKMDNGASRTLTYENYPNVAVGTRVQMQGNQMIVRG